MGNNQAYTDFEFFVITCYNEGVLTKKLLKKFINHYNGIDIDTGGSHSLITIDGHSVEEVIILVSGGKLPKKPPMYHGNEEEALAWEKYYDDLWKKVSKYTGDWR